MSLVDIRKISRSYGRVQALKQVSLQLEPGTIGLVGNNGAGKSTLLKILLGLLRPDQGSGSILGCDLMSASSQLRGRVGYMPEAAATVPILKGVEFVTLSGDLYGMRHRDARRRAHEVLNYVGLGELRYRRLEEYSSGNLQRLKLAAALVHDPQLLLLDEPTSGLDPQGRMSMLRLLEDLISETGKSVILCTHLLGDVERLCQQVVVLHRGTVLMSGSMAQLRQQTSGRYEVSWMADVENPRDDTFVQSLQQAGAVVTERPSAQRVRVTVPDDWTTRKFFELAQQQQIVLNQVRAEEEDLEGLFLRVTRDGDTNSTLAQSATQP